MKLARRRADEEMDRPDVDPAALADGLRDLERYNRWLGGRRSALRLVLGVAQRLGRERITMLDVGSGGADIPLALARAARARGVDLRITLADLHPETVAYARLRTRSVSTIRIVRANALALPFADAAFDLATSFTTLHHFERQDAERLLREMDRVARSAVVVTDLSRSRAALAGARLLAATVWRRHPITRHDGPVSVRGAFTPAEIRELAEECLRGRVRVRRHPFFRLSAVAEREGEG